jgi:hypothetical protein
MKVLISGLEQYSSMLRERWISLLFLALILHTPFLIQAIFYPVFGLLPSAIRILVDGLLLLVGGSLIACGPVIFLQNLTDSRVLGFEASFKRIRSLGGRGVWNILLVISFVHLSAMGPILIPISLMLVPAFLWLGFLLTLVYLPIWIFILTFLGFSLHHYYFMQEVSMRPLKASFAFVRQNLWVVLGVYLVSILIRLGLYLGFGFLKTLGFLWTLGTEVSRPGAFDGYSEMITKAQNGGLTPELLRDLSSRVGVFFEPSLVGTLEGVAGEFLLTSLWAFFFLYISGYYRGEKVISFSEQ